MQYKSVKTRLSAALAGVSAFIVAAPAGAVNLSTAVGGGGACSTSAGSATDPFLGFLCLLYNWTTGSLAIVFSIIALLVGVLFGVGRGSLYPALIGLAFAALFMVGPNAISYMIRGATLPILT